MCRYTHPDDLIAVADEFDSLRRLCDAVAAERAYLAAREAEGVDADADDAAWREFVDAMDWLDDAA